jgi:hypothetical protein
LAHGPMDVPEDPIDFVSGPNSIETSSISSLCLALGRSDKLPRFHASVSCECENFTARLRQDRRPKRIGEATKWPSLAHAVESIAAGKMAGCEGDASARLLGCENNVFDLAEMLCAAERNAYSADI